MKFQILGVLLRASVYAILRGGSMERVFNVIIWASVLALIVWVVL
jgi:hypothetical protein